ncbi:Calcium-transporting ATPase 10, plasma membrane-type [Linum perenne]
MKTTIASPSKPIASSFSSHWRFHFSSDCRPNYRRKWHRVGSQVPPAKISSCSIRSLPHLFCPTGIPTPHPETPMRAAESVSDSISNLPSAPPTNRSPVPSMFDNWSWKSRLNNPTPYNLNASTVCTKRVSKGVRDMPGSLQTATSNIPSGKALMYFGLFLATGVFFVFIAFSLFLPRLPFSLGFIGSMVDTIYVSMVLHSYVLSVLFSVIQVMALAYYGISYFPGGSTGLKFLTSSLTSSATRIFGRSYEREKVPADEQQLTQWSLPEDDLVLLAVVGLKEPCRPGVRDTVRLCQELELRYISHFLLLKRCC